MELWVYDSDGDIYIFRTKEKAMDAFKEWYVEKCYISSLEKENAIQNMEKYGYHYDERIYATELID